MVAGSGEEWRETAAAQIYLAISEPWQRLTPKLSLQATREWGEAAVTTWVPLPIAYFSAEIPAPHC